MIGSMELVLPKQYVELEQEEMMYLDGGWDLWKVARNAIGMTAHWTIAWIGVAIYNFVKSNPGIGMWAMIGQMAVTAAQALWALPWWAKLGGLAAGAATIYAIGTWDLF